MGSQHSPCLTVQLQSLMGKVVCADTWKNTQIEIRTSAWPPQRQPHTLPSLKVKHIHPPTSPPSLSLSVSFTTFASLALLSGFTDQRREQLHQRRSGGLEMKRCVAVGKHLATGGGAAEGVGWGGGAGRCAAGSPAFAAAFQRGMLASEGRTLNHKRGNRRVVRA